MIRLVVVALVTWWMALGVDAQEGHPVIPPGQEDLLAQMLGLGVSLPGDCKFTGGQADGPAIRATYRCGGAAPSTPGQGGGEIVLKLLHPSEAPPAATRTEHFAVTVESGSPPDGLVDALTTRIRSQEGGFKWLWIAPQGGSGSRPTIELAAIALVGAAVLGLAWYLLRSRRTSPRT